MRAKINNETVQSMKQSLMVGLTLKEACELEDISTSTWRRYEAKHPDIRRKRKRWQKALEIRAKVIIANKVYDKDKPSGYYAQYILDRQLDRETKNAQNALTRANARKVNMETKRIEAEINRLENGDEGITKIVFSDDLKPDKEDDSKQKGSEDNGADTKSK
ncbi:hypothetical protein [Limosilactobacillus reuteri]|uniref:hypothetical protein n=1 Tax=Limosilactobacillus reuteri TaxID=1598 RepID=UPI00398D4D26